MFLSSVAQSQASTQKKACALMHPVTAHLTEQSAQLNANLPSAACGIDIFQQHRDCRKHLQVVVEGEVKVADGLELVQAGGHTYKGVVRQVQSC